MWWFFPQKAREDPSVKELTQGIDEQTGKLKIAIDKLDIEVISMKKERREMDEMLDEAISLVSRRKR